MRKHPFLAVILAGTPLFLFGALLLVAWQSQPKFSLQDAERIRLDMTRARVEQILGTPPLSFGKQNANAFGRECTASGLPWENYVEPESWSKWGDDKLGVAVGFDSEDRVVGVFRHWNDGPNSFLGKIKQLLGFGREPNAASGDFRMPAPRKASPVTD